MNIQRRKSKVKGEISKDLLFELEKLAEKSGLKINQLIEKISNG
jgi:hypothetical protein